MAHAKGADCPADGGLRQLRVAHDQRHRGPAEPILVGVVSQLHQPKLGGGRAGGLLHGPADTPPAHCRPLPKRATPWQQHANPFRGHSADKRLSVFRKRLAHPKGFEPLTSAFGGQRSIQLSYGCFFVWPLRLAPTLLIAAYKAKRARLAKASPFLLLHQGLQPCLAASMGRCSARWARAAFGSIPREAAISWICSGVRAPFS